MIVYVNAVSAEQGHGHGRLGKWLGHKSKDRDRDRDKAITDVAAKGEGEAQLG